MKYNHFLLLSIKRLQPFAGMLFGCLTAFYMILPQVSLGQSRQLKDRVSADRLSVEAQFGIGAPVFEKNQHTVYSLPSGQVGLRYMFTQTWGIKAHVAYHDFAEIPVWNREGGAYHMQIYQYGASAVYSLSDYFAEERILGRRINALVHAGMSYSQGRYWGGRAGLEPDATLGRDRAMANDALVTVMLGSTFQFKPRWSKRVVFTADLTLHYNAFQNNRFDGTSKVFPAEQFDRIFDPNLFIMPSLGVQYLLGRHDWHVDWR